MCVRTICAYPKFALPVNPYGPGDSSDFETSHVTPALIRKCVEAKLLGAEKIVAWGTGEVCREFLYVKNAAEGILLAAENYNCADPVNLGSGEEITIRELVDLIRELTGFEGKIEWDTSKPDGQPRRCVDTSRAAREFGFKAKTCLREGLSGTIRWYESTCTSSTENESAISRL